MTSTALPALSDLPDGGAIPGVIRIENFDKDAAKEIVFDMTRAVYPHDQIYGQFCPINAYVAAPPREVYEYLADTRSLEEWTYSLRGFHETEEPGLRESFDRVGGFDPSLPVYNDLDLLVRLLDAGMCYESVGRALVIHSTAGPDHLSTRDERRARGVEQYLAKYSDRLTWRQRRTILQDIYLSRHRAGQPFAQGVRLVFLILATSSPREVLSSARSRMTGSGRPYS